MNIQPFAWGVFLSAAITVNAGERLTIAASPLQSFAPTNVMVRVHVPPDDANRALEVSADSGEYYRSSLIQLAGKDAPRTITVEFPRLPGDLRDSWSAPRQRWPCAGVRTPTGERPSFGQR